MSPPRALLAPPILCIMLATAAPAMAAEIDVQVRGADGKPVREAVVMVESSTWRPAPFRFPWDYVVAQQNIQFAPHVLIVPVGADVTFPNRDKVRHHVYSFSKPKKFELKLYSREEARAVRFDKPGAVALGCNIHDSMSAFIMVVDTPFAAKTDAQGRVSIPDVPGGAATLRVWHPLARIKGNEVAQPITVPASGSFARIVALDLRPATAL